ncbi:hypothetical protein RHSIM_Rhsim08G0089800 [Rhododendron simsii]|uniref:Uncharacterized protein n=1 Tax=Rhododendron simsii TaxID=118357 RepID=A0A834LE40_RHOSS|nr:hypothetical protein RHSIM_Rhsim08G0089800 [Rhododendron simsii]
MLEKILLLCYISSVGYECGHSSIHQSALTGSWKYCFDSEVEAPLVMLREGSEGFHALDVPSDSVDPFSARGASGTANRAVDLDIFQCFTANCVRMCSGEKSKNLSGLSRYGFIAQDASELLPMAMVCDVEVLTHDLV